MLFDTHCHVNFKAFDKTYKQVVQASLRRGLKLNIVGSGYDTSKLALDIAYEFKGNPVYASVGMHPIHSEDEKFDYAGFRAMAGDEKVIAIGETGIDLYRDIDIAKQEEVFRQHIKIAKEVKKPLILHSRASKRDSDDSYKKLLDIVSREQVRGVLHCFSGSLEMAEKFLDLGFYISFTGIITFKNSSLDDVIRAVPLDRVLVETDAPYLAPEPFRGKNNYPYYVEYVARKIAELKGMPFEDVAKKTTENAIKLFCV